jgi:hypothetical protein
MTACIFLCTIARQVEYRRLFLFDLFARERVSVPIAGQYRRWFFRRIEVPQTAKGEKHPQFRISQAVPPKTMKLQRSASSHHSQTYASISG